LAAKPKLTHAAKPATFEVEAYNERGEMVPTAVAGEHPLTIYLDKREIVTLMTLGHAPEALAIGYLRNQRLADSIDDIAAVQVDWETESVAVTTRKRKDLSSRLGKKTVTCEKIFFSRMRTSSSFSRRCASTRPSTSKPARFTAARSPARRARS
jgi:formate dehydrogenase assembly factor FdhD